METWKKELYKQANTPETTVCHSIFIWHKQFNCFMYDKQGSFNMEIMYLSLQQGFEPLSNALFPVLEPVFLWQVLV